MKRFLLLIFISMNAFGQSALDVKEQLDTYIAKYNNSQMSTKTSQDLLFYAAKYGQKKIVKMMIQSDVSWCEDIVSDAFINSVVFGDLDMVKGFIEEGFDVNIYIHDDFNLLYLACALSDNVYVVQELVNNGAYFYTNNLKKMNKMVGSRVSEYGMPYYNYLLAASFSQNVDIMAYVLDFVEPVKENLVEFYNLVDQELITDETLISATALLFDSTLYDFVSELIMCDRFSQELLDVLIKSGNFNDFRYDDNKTLLHYLTAFYDGDFEQVLSKIVNSNYDINYESNNGVRPIDLCDVDSAKYNLLIQYGSEPVN